VSAPPASPRYRRAPQVITTALPAESILLDPSTQRMFSLNETARLVWTALENDVAMPERQMTFHSVPFASVSRSRGRSCRTLPYQSFRSILRPFP
jgi:hypothetical protein